MQANTDVGSSRPSDRPVMDGDDNDDEDNDDDYDEDDDDDDAESRMLVLGGHQMAQ